MKIKITSDSTCDLGAELLAKNDISIVPLAILLGDKTYLDGVNISAKDILKHVDETGELPKTSAPSVDYYTNFFSTFVDKYDAVIHFSISSKASASNNNAKQASKSFENVFVVDSYSLSTGQGCLILKACDMANDGLSATEIVDNCLLMREKINTSFIPERLDFLHKGGRCSLASLIGASVLRIHPMIDMKDGELYAKKKFMGNMTVALKKYIAELKECYPEYDKKYCFITNCDCSSAFIEQAKTLVAENFNFENVYITSTGSVITSHCGRGTLGVLFITK